MNIPSLKTEYTRSSPQAAVIPEEATEAVVDIVEEAKEESSRLSPMSLFNTIAKNEQPSQINSAQDFEKFMMAMIQDHLDTNHSQLEVHHTHLEQVQKRKAALLEKLKELNISINSDGSVAFWSSAQGWMTLASVAIGLGSLVASLPTVLGATVGFLTAWTTAIKFFFEGRRDEQKAGMIPIREAHDITCDDLKSRSKVISKSLEEWNTLAMRLANVIKSHSNVREQGMQNIRRKS